MKTTKLCILALLVCTAISERLTAQSYLQPTLFTQGVVDAIDLSTLDLQMAFPVISKPGRGVGTSFGISYDGNFWQSPYNVWSASGGFFGWNFDPNTYSGAYAVTGYSETSCTPNDREHDLVTEQYYNRQYTDQYGIVHTFSGEDDYNECTGADSGYPAWSSSGDGYTIDSFSRVYDQHGNNVYSLGRVDQNGNSLSIGPDPRCSSAFAISACVVDTAGKAALGTDFTGNVSPSVIHYYYLDTTGAKQTITVTLGSFTIQTNFGISGVSEYGPQTHTLPTSITYPYGTYTFTYESTPGHAGAVTGRLASVTLPTSGTISYSYTGAHDGIVAGATNTTAGINRTTTDGTTQFVSSAPSSGVVQTAIQFPSGRTATYQFTQVAPSWVEHTYLPTQITNNGTTTNICYSGNGADYNYQSFSCATTNVSLPILQKQITATLDNGMSQVVTESYSVNGVITERDVSDFAASSPPLLQKTLYTYSPAFPNKYDRTASIVTEDASNNVISQSQFFYDETAASVTSGLPNHVAPTVAPGNLTRTSRWNSTTNTWLDTHYVYDDAGQMQSVSGPGPGQTSFTYDSTDSYVTQTAYPTVGSVTLTSQASYDINSGQLMSQTDVNHHKTIFTYDGSLRLISKTRDTTTGGDGGSKGYTYPSNQRISISETIGNGNSTDLEIIMDGYGRHVRKATPSGLTPNAWFLSDTCFNSDSQSSFQSLPYAGSSITSALVCSGEGDSSVYDVNGRPSSVTHADGSQILYSYKGRARRIVDEGAASVHNTRALQYDGLGRLTTVCEYSSGTTLVGSPAAVGCGTDMNVSGADATATGYITQYVYNLANRSVTLSQSGAVRTWQYDSLGRMIFEQIPERVGATTMGYSITSSGYSMTRKRVKPNQAWATTSPVYVTTTTSLDPLGRPTSIGYDDGVTQGSSFTYDVGTTTPASHNMLGALASASVGAITQQLSYTSNGQIEWEQTCLASTCGLSSPTYVLQQLQYNLLGQVLSASDGVSNTVTHQYDSLGRLSLASESLQDATHPGTLVSGLAYGPLGVLSEAEGNGLAASQFYDSRGRPSGFQVGVSGGAVSYGYSLTIGANGSVIHSTDSQTGSWGYGYDEFNRLINASTDSGSQAFNYQYDVWGNRVSQTVTAGSGYSTPPTLFDASHGNHNSNFMYYASGDVQNDGTNNYTYDPEGRIVSVNSQINYVYGPDGSRVGVQSASSVKNYVYGVDGQLSSFWNGTTFTKANLYVGGSKLGFYDATGTSFVYSDWTGSTRVVTNSSGSVVANYSSMPFGMLTPLTTPSDQAQISGLDWDSESLTGHSWSRQYSPWSGSWFSPDQSNTSYDFTNPQSLNRYAYVQNDPMSYSDPLGLARWSDAPDNDAASSDSSFYGATSAPQKVGCQPGDDDACRGAVDLYKWLKSLLGGDPNKTPPSQPPSAPPPPDDGGGLDGLARHTLAPIFNTTARTVGFSAQQQSGSSSPSQPVSAKGQKEINAAYQLACSHSADGCSSGQQATVRYVGFTYNVQIAGDVMDTSTLPADSIKDPGITNKIFHKGAPDSFYLSSPIGMAGANVPHVVDDPAGIEAHIDHFGPANPIHWGEAILSLFINTRAQAGAGFTQTCSPGGGCQ
jgi:RHS repeat-associated protein